MNTQNFQTLIQKITNRDFLINTTEEEIQLGKEYQIFRILPLTKMKISFKWKAATSEDKILRSFITAFTTKYLEPNPKAYDYSAKTYGESALWVNKSEEEKEYACRHHRSNMLSKEDLMKQVEFNFNTPEMESTMLRYGFYPTEYGIGIFCFWETQSVVNAINAMAKYLQKTSIPFKNEFSDARWVLRFKLGLTKEQHIFLLSNFN